MLKIYGSMLCPDCVECRAAFDEHGIVYTFLDFNDSLLHLKEFLPIRDHDLLFQNVKKTGRIGIPCIVTEDESVSLDWESFL